MMCFFIESCNYLDYENKKVKGCVKDAALYLNIWENNNKSIDDFNILNEINDGDLK